MRKIFHCGKLLVIVLLFLAIETSTTRAQNNDAAVNHAKRIMELTLQEKFEEIVAEFNTEMAAAITLDQMKQAGGTVKVRFGKFKSFVDQKVTSPAEGVTVVILGCQFENATFEMTTVFDSENKIAGVGLRPRQ